MPLIVIVVLPMLSIYWAHIQTSCFHYIKTILNATQPKPSQQSLDAIEPLLKQLTACHLHMQQYPIPKEVMPWQEKTSLGLELGLKFKLAEGDPSDARLAARLEAFLYAPSLKSNNMKWLDDHRIIFNKSSCDFSLVFPNNVDLAPLLKALKPVIRELKVNILKPNELKY